MSDRVNILGTRVSRYNLSETVELMTDAIQNQKKLRIAVTPVNCILWARKNSRLREIYNSAEIVTADGVPVVWASKLFKKPIRGRVTGLDLLPEFAKVAASKNFSFFFLGAAEGVGERLARALQDNYPGLNIAGTYSPPFAVKFSEEENERIIDKVNRANPDVLWVSLTAPKQDYWIASHFDKLNVSVAIGVGAAFDVVAGNVKRSPEWMQKWGLEWLFRLIQEPRRLARRYLFEAPVFLPLIVKQAIQRKKRDGNSEKT
ncbi:MAG: WecB/TagA/CpsF family glycosyltransferase [Balneolaceae bacterium]|nr:WecB/TagA/CpsF family glycosyltransferase [Balneolaceae bacterium]